MSVGIPEPKIIKELQNLKFFIPAYQRGYRWTTQEVGDLLDDINEFNIGDSASPKSYCLQPLIVKKREDGSFEVVDGQQRLTTIYIFLKIAQKITDYEPYQIDFETRKQSKVFLTNLSNYDGSINDDNIDYYHITKAYKRINEWLDFMSSNGTPRFTILSSLFNKITNNVFFIWYEIPDNAKPVEIFTRVNMGKIRLSNAELVKALIFNRANFPQDGEVEQQELSLAWNRIERDFQRESFWHFLFEAGEREYETRIDLIFDLLADKYNAKLPQQQQITVPVSTAYYNRTFLIFYAVYKNSQNKNEFVKDLWKDVNRIYERFLEWYDDLNKYHIIGFLIYSGTKIERLFELSDGKKKSEIISSLVEETKQHVKLKTLESLRGLTYDDSKKKLRQFFLLVNIATLVCKNEKQYRFPFDIFKKERWDIEHIHATADSTDEPDDSIGNLTLLLAKINRSYQDDEFFDKRKEIISRDKKGMFIPVVTKNVFTKQYSNHIENMDKWELFDKDDYTQAMWDVLDTFWKEVFDK
ncbi:MAG: DUF262 domain-containing protein [Clostridiales bacterium]|nr:DUF262 domain-containing protein [Clostridiales bacterium]